MAAMPPERSRSLHNFSLPPRLNWGSQRLLRCSKLHQSSSNDDVSFSDRKRRNAAFPFRSPLSPPDDSQIDVIREKLMLDLRSEVDKIRANFLGNSDFAPPPPPESRPWNLRTRRSPATAEVAPPIAADAFVSGGGGGGDGGGGERAKFSVPLSRNEIEDDFVEMTGRRPPRKPKKRPRYIQRQLDVSCRFFLIDFNINFYFVC